MKNNKDLIVGIVLVLASVAVCARYFYLREEIENFFRSVFLGRAVFVIFSLTLAVAGIKKIISYKNSIKSNKDKNNDV
ncbi:MAG: hypothetical protein CSB21_00750 [Deltaproteobacteria bacterium]|nr:MAG: hypothetical protein CSB21_00750 [Deltaproteobacteria bacterium]